jgi:hypothetical protein
MRQTTIRLLGRILLPVRHTEEIWGWFDFITVAVGVSAAVVLAALMQFILNRPTAEIVAAIALFFLLLTLWAALQLQREIDELKAARDIKPFISALTGDVRDQGGYPKAGVTVTVGGHGPCKRVRGRLESIEFNDTAPSGLLQWSSYDGGGAECDIDSEAWLEVFTVEDINWATICYWDHSLRTHRLFHRIGTSPSRFIATIVFGGDDCNAIRKTFLLEMSVPHRTVDKEDKETLWLFPGWFPTVTFQAVE